MTTKDFKEISCTVADLQYLIVEVNLLKITSSKTCIIVSTIASFTVCHACLQVPRERERGLDMFRGYRCTVSCPCKKYKSFLNWVFLGICV